MYKKISSVLFKNDNKMCLQIIYLMFKDDLVLNNLQQLICHKTQPNQTLNANSVL